MNGFQEIRLFDTAAPDVEPNVGSNTYTNILPALLADNGPGTGADITPGEVYTYLGRSVEIAGLAPGPHHFWLEAVDTVGKSSGVQRVGSHTVVGDSVGLDPTTLVGTHVVIAGAADEQDFADQNNVLNGGYTLESGVLTVSANERMTFDYASLSFPGRYTQYAVYRRTASEGRVLDRGTNENVGIRFFEGNITTFPQNTYLYTYNPLSDAYHIVIMRKNASTIRWDVWDENGTEVRRNVTNIDENDNSETAFASHVMEGASLKALGLVSYYVSDSDVESIVEFLADRY
jgi:hypothetical protein